MLEDAQIECVPSVDAPPIEVVAPFVPAPGTAVLSGLCGDETRRVMVLGRERVLRATWDPDADDGNGAMRNDALHLVKVHVEGEEMPRDICVERLVRTEATQ